MGMQVRGWRLERHVWTYDTTGRRVPIVTGLTIDQAGRPVAAIAIGDGPTAILDGDASQLRANLAATAEDQATRERRGR